MEVFEGIPLIDTAALADYARSCAKLLPVTGSVLSRSVLQELSHYMEKLKKNCISVQKHCSALSSPPAACEWLVENRYLAEREFRAAAGDLRACGELRTSGQDVLITALALSLIRSGHGKVTEQRINNFLTGFQETTPLKGRELRILPAALRYAIIKCIADVSSKMLFSSDLSPHADALEALFSSLRLLPDIDFEKLAASASSANRVFLRDPTGEYPRMTSATRLDYLLRLEKLAKQAGKAEASLASEILQKAEAEGKHIGFYLFSGKKPDGALYIAANVLLSLFFSLLIAFITKSPLSGVLLLLPASELVKRVIDFFVIRTVTPARIPQMDVSNGIPPEGKTVCVISALLTDESSAKSAASRLEELRLVSKSEGKNLIFGILADLPASDEKYSDGDEVVIKAATNAVDVLNRKYGGGFFLFTRERTFDGEKFTGFERKRGALTALSKLLIGLESELDVHGNISALSGTNFIVTLDSDTRIYPGAAGKLIGAMLHPLCRPVIDSKKHIVASGHGLIHPRIDTDLASACATDFALIFAGSGGCDPYGSLCGELYMDAFGSGGFCGKGIIDARALLECTADFPNGLILSHDALEGAALRGGYMGDVQFSDSFPARPLSYYKRLARWTRGDWQNSLWLFKRGKHFRAIDRWRLFDSLRRSLIPSSTFLAIFLGFILPGIGISAAAIAALLALLCELFMSFAELRNRRGLRRYSRLLTGIGGAIVRSFMELWLLPYKAYITFRSALTALWRMLVSKKRLLEWQTAAQSDRLGGGFLKYCADMWFSLLTGLAALILSRVIIGQSAGLMWLVSPAALAALALPAHAERELSSSDRKYLRTRAAECWKYFSELSKAEDNFLPPDNFQSQPPIGTAHRTSPTNIGLAMVSAVGACDMGIISEVDAAEYLARIETTLEKMPKHMGHFLNWYDTRTLKPLEPEFISTVDSGNLCACLIVAARAADEYGRTELASRIDRLAANMRFDSLFDKKKGLFYICYDTERSRPAGGWYDLMASEAMLTSYLAVSRGDVPAEHWKKLSRAQVKKDSFRGLASWTGTMFEYLMPELFLPIYRSSLIYESCRFCLYVQQHRMPPDKPWGMSESAFFSLDRSLGYKYKAHGCQALSLHTGMDNDTVISPYSSFLALAVDPISAVKNLRKLERFGALGRYGYIEAIDFSPQRSRTQYGERVKCYMAHHIGMSITAAANALCEESIIARFMAAPCMEAHTLFLQEMLPDNAAVLPERDTFRPERICSQEHWKKLGLTADAVSACALSNGVYNIMFTSLCKSIASLRDTAVYNGSMQVFLNDRQLFPGAVENWEFSEDKCRFFAGTGGITCELSVGTAAGDWGEFRVFKLYSKERTVADMSVQFIPILAPYSNYVNHSAYWRLGLYAREEDGKLLIRRVEKGAQREIWMCVASSRPTRFSADESGSSGWLIHPKISVTSSVPLNGVEESELVLAIALAGDKHGAVAAAERILAAGDSDAGNMLGAAASRLGMSNAEISAAFDMLPDILNNPVTAAPAKSALWEYGISGDHSIISCRLDAVEAEKLAARFCLLKCCGVECDLVYLTDSIGEYTQPSRRRIEAALTKWGLDALVGAPAGIHFVPLRALPVISQRSAVSIGTEKALLPELCIPALSRGRAASVPEYSSGIGYFKFTVKNTLPAKPWQNILTNGCFGYIASDSGTGYMWLDNAREQPLTPPPADESAITGAESLWIELNSIPYSLFAANDGLNCTVSYYPGRAVWRKDFGGFIVETEAFIPDDVNVRLFIIRGLHNMTLHWSLSPMHPDSTICSEESGYFSVRYNEYQGLCMYLSANSPAKYTAGYAGNSVLAEIDVSDTAVLAAGCCPPDMLKRLCDTDTAFLHIPKRWNDILTRFSLRSDVKPLDRYMNCWCVYQAISCRLEARASLYQQGGAFGFRDQLQDAANLLLISSDYLHNRIFDCCRHQYAEGDVMHWWHGEKGLRSRCSDDLLWLPWALCRYVEATGNEGICFEVVPYIISPPLADSERDRYEQPSPGDDAPILAHARSAIEKVITRGFGPHALPYIGSGDWNDALDNVNGESLWLGWFFSLCAEKFAALLERLGQSGSERYREFSKRVKAACEECFNGQYYPRGYLAEGAVLGGNTRIDSVAQSWAAFCGAQNASTALDSALARLVDIKNSLVRLLWPPYSPYESPLGYISSYGQGIRENGGQYTHGAIWLAIACFRLKRPDDGFRILEMLLPENHDITKYLGEPFVLSADVCSLGAHAGEAGWTWYTGSAGWFFRAITEEMLGLRIQNGALTVSPCLPSRIEGYEVRWRGRHIAVSGGQIKVDGVPYSGGWIHPVS